jgi:hypothetical protein
VRLLRRDPLATVEVALHPPTGAAVTVLPAPGRDDGQVDRDRLELLVGLAALAVGDTSQARWPALREGLARLAGGIVAAGSEELPTGLVPLEPFGGRGHLALVSAGAHSDWVTRADVISGAAGTVPRLRSRPDHPGPSVELSALAAPLAVARMAGREERLAIGFGLEGLLAWHREADRRSPPYKALAFATAHMDGRLAELGLAWPPE